MSQLKRNNSSVKHDDEDIAVEEKNEQNEHDQQQPDAYVAKKSSRYLSAREARELHRLLEKVCRAGVAKLPTTSEERKHIRRQHKLHNHSDEREVGEEIHQERDEDDQVDDGDEEHDSDEEDVEFELPLHDEEAILADETISDREKAERLESLREKIINSKKQQNAVNASAARCILKNLDQEGYLALEISDEEETDDDEENEGEEEANHDEAALHEHQNSSKTSSFVNKNDGDENSKSKSLIAGSKPRQRKSVTLAPFPPSASANPNSSHNNNPHLTRANSKSFGASTSSVGSFSMMHSTSSMSHKRREELQQKVVSTLKSVMEQSKKSKEASELKRAVSFTSKSGNSNEQQQQHQLIHKDRSTVKALFAHTRKASPSSSLQLQKDNNNNSSFSPDSSRSNRKMTTKALLRSSRNFNGSNSANSIPAGASAAKNASDSITAVLNAVAGVFSCRYVALLVPDELKLRELRCVAYGGADANSRPMSSFSSSSSGSHHMLVPAASLALHHNTVINVRYPDSGDESDVEGSDLKELAAKRRQRELLQQQGKSKPSAAFDNNGTDSASTMSGLKRKKHFQPGAVSTCLSVPIPGPSNYAVAVLHLMDRSFGVENFSREDESISWCYARIIARLIGAFESGRRVAPDRQVQNALATVLRTVDNATGAIDAAKIRKVLEGDSSTNQAGNNSMNHNNNIHNKGNNNSHNTTSRGGMDGGWDDHAVTRAPPVFRTYSNRVSAMVAKLISNGVLFTTKTSEARGAIVDCEYHVNLNHFSKNTVSNDNDHNNNTTENEKSSANCCDAGNLLHPVVQADDLLPLCVLTDHVHRVADAWYRTAALLAESRSEVGNLQLDVKRLSQEVNTMRLKLEVQRQMLLGGAGGYHVQNVLQRPGTNNNNRDGVASESNLETSTSANNNNNAATVVIKRDKITGAVVIERGKNNNSPSSPFSLASMDDEKTTSQQLPKITVVGNNKR